MSHLNSVEEFVVYYDIMVRHAGGNLRDLMREASYSPVMATWLTYMNSASLAYSGTKPDENYAREIMQRNYAGTRTLVCPPASPSVDQSSRPCCNSLYHRPLGVE